MVTNRRRLILVVGFGALVAAAGYLAVWLSVRPHQINEASVKRFQTGMTQAEVEAVLGVPPGDYSEIQLSKKSQRIIACAITIAHEGPLDIGDTVKRWITDEITVAVSFDSLGKANLWRIERITISPPESFSEKIRRCLGL